MDREIPKNFIYYTCIHLIWDLVVFGTCTYVVFWLNQSGWWYLLALIIAGGLPSYRTYLGLDDGDD